MATARATILRMEHILRFPEETVGYLWHDAPAGEELKPIGPAQGVVQVPPGARVHFEVTDPTQLPCLAPLAPEGLVSLGLNKTRVTDGDLAALAPFQGLTFVNLSGASAMGDEGLAHLQSLRRLEVLNLYATRVSDAGLVHLRQLDALQHLHLGATRVRGSGLQWLSGLKALRRLSLEDTRVEDAALAPLDGVPLRELVLRGTLVTRLGAAEFDRHRPVCALVGDWDQNERQLGASRRRRRFLSALVHRIVPKHPLAYTLSEEEHLAVLKRLLPPGTRLDAVAADGQEVASMTAGLDWEAEPEPDRSIHDFLLRVPRYGQVGITLPGGSRYTVPWLVDRGPERRGRSRAVSRTAN